MSMIGCAALGLSLAPRGEHAVGYACGPSGCDLIMRETDPGITIGVAVVLASFFYGLPAFARFVVSLYRDDLKNAARTDRRR